MINGWKVSDRFLHVVSGSQVANCEKFGNIFTRSFILPWTLYGEILRVLCSYKLKFNKNLSNLSGDKKLAKNNHEGDLKLLKSFL